MQTKQITLKEYCQLSGYSYDSRWINKQLGAGNLTVGMVSASRFGWSWNIEVLISWYDGKINEK